MLFSAMRLLPVLTLLFSFCSSEVIQIKSYDDFLKASILPKAVIMTDAIWCPGCTEIKPTFESEAKNYPDIPFYIVDVNDHEDIAKKMGVETMPTIILYARGEQINKRGGGGWSWKEFMKGY